MTIDLIFDLLDVATFVALIICAAITFKIYKLIRVDAVAWIFIGFVTMATLAALFVIGDMIPLNVPTVFHEISLSRFVNELLVAVRVVPVIFMAIGMSALYKSVRVLIINGNGKGDKGDKGDTGAIGATGATGAEGDAWNGRERRKK